MLCELGRYEVCILTHSDLCSFHVPARLARAGIYLSPVNASLSSRCLGARPGLDDGPAASFILFDVLAVLVSGLTASRLCEVGVSKSARLVDWPSDLFPHPLKGNGIVYNSNETDVLILCLARVHMFTYAS